MIMDGNYFKTWFLPQISLWKLWFEGAQPNQVIGYDGTEIKWITLNNNWNSEI